MSAFTKKAVHLSQLVLVTAALTACGGGSTSAPGSSATPVQGSSESSSGSMAVFTEKGVTYTVTPGASTAGGDGVAKLLTLPNSGNMAAGVQAVSAVSAVDIITSLSQVDGIALDPANDVGVAYSYDSGTVSVFKLSTKSQVSTYDTLTTNELYYSGSWATIAGIIMDSSTKTMIIATADGIEMVSYSNPAAPSKVIEVPSLGVDPVNGVEIMENFAYDDQVPVGGTNHKLVVTGGEHAGSYAMVLVDITSGAVYRPDNATNALFTVNNYIDAAAVDTEYNVAILADESYGTTFVDLNQLSLNSTAGTYTLPAAAVSYIGTYYKYTNLAVESSQHMVMMGKGYGGTSVVVAELDNPATALGFKKEALIDMPDGTDDQNNNVYWSGSHDPHGAGAYITASGNPSYPNPTALGVWVEGNGNHLAIINIKNVLEGVLAQAGAYDPAANTPDDVQYFLIP